MVRCVLVDNEDSHKIFTEFVVELVHYHVEYARLIGLNDLKSLNYSVQQVEERMNDRDNYILLYDDVPVGTLQVEHQISDVDNEPICFVGSLYVKEEYRRKGIGKHALQFVCKTHKNTRIELDCWYGIPAYALYESFGV